MTCYHPLDAAYSRDLNPSGKRSLVFNLSSPSASVHRIKVPCGQCVGCRLERGRQWAIRCMHEKRMSTAAVFATLTYSDDKLPVSSRGAPTLVRRDATLFMKRLRKKFGPNIRFFGCGEYGGVTGRPHYHILLFNFDPPDKKFYKFAKGGERLYNSASLDDVWTYGYVVLGDVSFDSARYVAGYILKKVKGAGPFCDVTNREAEFGMMSRMPGIGRKWLDAYVREAYAHDTVIIDAKETSIPRYYDTIFEGIDAKRLEVLKRKRRRDIVRSEQTPERLRVREHIVKSALDYTKKVEL